MGRPLHACAGGAVEDHDALDCAGMAGLHVQWGGPMLGEILLITMHRASCVCSQDALIP